MDRVNHVYVEITEEPRMYGIGFHYGNEGIPGGRITGANSTAKRKTFPTIKIHGYEGFFIVVVSLISHVQPYYPHPHKLIGADCKDGVFLKLITDSKSTYCFSDLRIQGVKMEDSEESLKLREHTKYYPFRTGFSYNLNKINFSAVRLCFHVILTGSRVELSKLIPLKPVKSQPFYDSAQLRRPGEYFKNKKLPVNSFEIDEAQFRRPGEYFKYKKLPPSPFEVDEAHELLKYLEDKISPANPVQVPEVPLLLSGKYFKFEKSAESPIELGAVQKRFRKYLEDKKSTAIPAQVPTAQNVENHLRNKISRKRPIPVPETQNFENNIRNKKSCKRPIPAPKISSVQRCSSSPENVISKNTLITTDDVRRRECTIYDVYVSYADEDTSIAQAFAHILESPEVGFKVFIRGRNMLAGCRELETNIELIRHRCKRMLIILTPNYVKSPVMEFLLGSATSFAIEQEERILIPVIWSVCEIPALLDNVSKIDFTEESTHDFMMDKLIASIISKGPSTARSQLGSNRKYNLSRTVQNYSNTHITPSADISDKESKSRASSEAPPSAAYTETFQSLACFKSKKLLLPYESTSKNCKHLLLFNRKVNSKKENLTSFSSGATRGFHNEYPSCLKNSNGYTDNMDVF